MTILWLATASACTIRAVRQSNAKWWICGSIGAVLASIAMFRWHVDVLTAGQDLLRSAGVYPDRVFVKVGIMILGIGILVVCAAKFGRKLFAGHARVTLLAMIVAAIYLAALTASLDNFLPSALADPPGRFVVEYVLGAVALGGVLMPGEERRDDR